MQKIIVTIIIVLAVIYLIRMAFNSVKKNSGKGRCCGGCGKEGS